MLANNNRAIKLGFLASGSGTSVEALVKEIQSGKLKGFEAVVVLCDLPRGKAGVYEKADKLGLPIEHAETTVDQLEIFKKLNIEMILGLGYVRKVEDGMLNYFGRKIWNIHPTLLPKYGGEGMYGLATHEAVVKAGDKETGATVHIMNSVYDDGQILNQVKIPVFPGETPAMLQKRVLLFEYALMASTLALYRDNLLPGCPK